ncbi:hypothetical protein [Spirosoma pulveris]
MNFWSIRTGILGLVLLSGCKTGTRDIDFVSKQFAATYNIDSTKGIDSTNLASLMGSKAIYSFSEDGKGMNHIQMGMVSRDTPFTWRVQQDSLYIDKKGYSIEKIDRGFTLRSDSAKIFLSQQP